jgi:pimeloyl-ACP methyl ester carboxylesterase
MGEMAAYTDGYWSSADGLRLHYRDYLGPVSRTPLLCIAGLTRNARDFEPVAEMLRGKRRIIAVDLRGRGESAFATDPSSYSPMVYAQDIDLLLHQLNLKKFVAVGTSLGGIVSMLLAQQWQKQLQGVILNDVGPEISGKGLDRIRSYVGNARTFDTWMHAARAMAEAQGPIYPDFKIEDWLRFAKRSCKLSGNGRIILDYDMKIAEPFKAAGGEAGADLWPYFQAFGDCPVLILRGEKSDILDKNIATKMMKKLPNATLAMISGVGHAPSLDEKESQAAIVAWLAQIK